MTSSRHARGTGFAVTLSLAISAQPGPAAAQQHSSTSAEQVAPQHEAVLANSRLDLSGKPRKGEASYYSPAFYHKKTASGKPLNLRVKVAASKTLPLGTVAQITNLETGKSVVLTIEDRGPYIKGRVLDVSPSAAETIGMKKEGVAPVEVKPLAIPERDAVQKPNAEAGKGRQPDKGQQRGDQHPGQPAASGLPRRNQ